MSKIRLASTALALALASACRGGGSGPTQPVEPAYRLVAPPPCLTAPPADPGAILRAIPECEADDEGGCPDLTDQQDAALWAYLDALERYAERAWRRCGDRPRSVPGGRGAASSPTP